MKVKDYPKYTVLPDGSVIGARGKKLKEDENSTGYKRVSLCKDGVVNRVFVHRLVAEHFVDNPTTYHVLIILMETVRTTGLRT